MKLKEFIREFKDTQGKVQPNLWYLYDAERGQIVGHYNFAYEDTAKECLGKWMKESPQEFKSKNMQVQKGDWLIKQGITKHNQSSLPGKK